MLATAACGGGEKPAQSPAAPGPAPVTLVELRITAPGSANLKDKIEVSASARYSDGSSRDVTREAVWSSSAPSVVSVSTMVPGGFAFASGLGDADVRATFEDKSAAVSISVGKDFPPGRWRFSGTVREEEPRRRGPLPGAAIQIVRGVNAGRSTTANSEGRFALADLAAGVFTLRVSKDNYYAFEREIVFERDSDGNSFGLRRSDDPLREPSNGALVIHRIRTRGPGGPADEFIELQNAGNFTIQQDDNWSILISDGHGVTRRLLEYSSYSGPRIPPGCSYLIASGRPGGYSGATAADAFIDYDLPDDGGIALVGAYLFIVDAVGLSDGAAFREGQPLQAFDAQNIDRSYVRAGRDTNDNRRDFVVESPSAPANTRSPCSPTGMR